MTELLTAISAPLEFNHRQLMLKAVAHNFFYNLFSNLPVNPMVFNIMYDFT